MSECPVCAIEIADAFGIVQCPQCKTMLVAEFDGSLKVQQDVSEPSLAPVVLETSSDLAVATSSEVMNSDWGGDAIVLEPEAKIEPRVELKVELQKIQGHRENDVFVSKNESLQDIQQFGNSKDSKLEQGELIYQLNFEDVDTQDLKSEILQCLKDQRLALLPSQIQIQSHRIAVLGLNPVKVSIIVNRLKRLPVQIHWEQHSLTGKI